jgi:hypothetical protein
LLACIKHHLRPDKAALENAHLFVVYHHWTEELLRDTSYLTTPMTESDARNFDTKSGFEEVKHFDKNNNCIAHLVKKPTALDEKKWDKMKKLYVRAPVNPKEKVKCFTRTLLGESQMRQLPKKRQLLLEEAADVDALEEEPNGQLVVLSPAAAAAATPAQLVTTETAPSHTPTKPPPNIDPHSPGLLPGLGKISTYLSEKLEKIHQSSTVPPEDLSLEKFECTVQNVFLSQEKYKNLIHHLQTAYSAETSICFHSDRCEQDLFLFACHGMKMFPWSDEDQQSSKPCLLISLRNLRLQQAVLCPNCYARSRVRIRRESRKRSAADAGVLSPSDPSSSARYTYLSPGQLVRRVEKTAKINKALKKRVVRLELKLSGCHFELNKELDTGLRDTLLQAFAKCTTSDARTLLSKELLHIVMQNVGG